MSEMRFGFLMVLVLETDFKNLPNTRTVNTSATVKILTPINTSKEEPEDKPHHFYVTDCRGVEGRTTQPRLFEIS